MNTPCKRCGEIDPNTFVDGDFCDKCYWIKEAHRLESERDRLREGLCEIANQGLEPWAARKALEILDNE